MWLLRHLDIVTILGLALGAEWLLLRQRRLLRHLSWTRLFHLLVLLTFLSGHRLRQVVEARGRP